MTRTVIPFAAFLSLVGLPAFAADLGDEAAPIEDGATDLADVTATDLADSADRAERRGGNKGKSGKSTGARSSNSGSRNSGASANRNSNSGRSPQAAQSGPRTEQSGPRAQASQPARSQSAQPARSPSTRSQGAQPARSAASNGPSSQVSRGKALPASSRGPAVQGNRTKTSPPPKASANRGSEGRGSNANRPSDNKPGANNVRPGRDGDHGRPGHAGNGHARPGKGGKKAKKHVVHHSNARPARWAPSWHRYHLRGVPRHSPRYWAAGIFVYSPPPRSHRVVVVDGGGNRVKNATTPSRAVDRNNSFSVGLRGGSYVSGYTDGGGYGDMGLGLSLAYRPVEAVGFDLTWMHHSDSWDENTERAQDPISASIELFAFPWTRVSPYGFVGLTVTPRAADDVYPTRTGETIYKANDALFGPHAGLGIEFALGSSAALSFDGRYIGYVDRQEGDTAAPGALQGQMGLNFYF